MSNENQQVSDHPDTFFEIDLRSEPVVTDEKLISNLERIIVLLRQGNTYTYQDKEELMYRTEEYVTGERKPLDSEIMKYLFTGWFIQTGCGNKPNQ